MAEVIYTGRGPFVSNESTTAPVPTGNPTENTETTFGQRGTPVISEGSLTSGRFAPVNVDLVTMAPNRGAVEDVEDVELGRSGFGQTVSNDPRGSLAPGDVVFDFANSATEIQYYGTPAPEPPSPAGTTPAPTPTTIVATGYSFDSSTITFTNPRASSTTSLYAATLPASGRISVVTPDVPRKIRVEVISAASPNDITGGVLVVVGTGINGQQVADCFDLQVGSSVTTVYDSDQAFATITYAGMSGVSLGAGGGVGSTVSIGESPALAVPVNRPATRLITGQFDQKIVAPLYFEPGYASDGWSGAGWSAAIAKPEVDIIIFNPAAPYSSAGPGMGTTGRAFEVVYRNSIIAARAAGKKVLGYTYGNWGARATAAVASDVAAYYAWYAPSAGLDGIFIDEAAAATGTVTGTRLVTYFGNIASNIKSYDASALVASLTGSTTDPSILDWSQICISYESTTAALTGYSPSEYQFQVSPARNALVIHSCTSIAQIQDAIIRCKSLNYGYVFCNTFVAPNSWGGLPSANFWAAECSAVASRNIETVADSFILYTIANDIGYLYCDMKYNRINRVPTNAYPRVYFDVGTGGFVIAGVTAKYMIENTLMYRWNLGSGLWQSTANVTALTNNIFHYQQRQSRTFIDSLKNSVRITMRPQEYYASWPYTRYSAIVTVPSMGTPSLTARPFLVPTCLIDDAPIALSTASGTVDYLAGTVTPPSGPDGSRKYVFSYSITPNPT